MPPNASRVTSAVCAPSRAARSDAITPAGPAPTTSTSTLLAGDEAIELIIQMGHATRHHPNRVSLPRRRETMCSRCRDRGSYREHIALSTVRRRESTLGRSPITIRALGWRGHWLGRRCAGSRTRSEGKRIEGEQLRFVAHVPYEVNLTGEFEIEHDETELEIELAWR